MATWAIAILPLIGVALGAGLHFLFSRAAERDKHASSLRSQAYSDYLRAVASAAHLTSDEDLRDAHRDVADAKARIAVYGSASVLKALARFEETGAALADARSARAFVTLVSAMRNGESAVHEDDLERVLLGASRTGSLLG